MATNVKRKRSRSHVGRRQHDADRTSERAAEPADHLRGGVCSGVIGFLAISDKLIDLLTAMAMNANYTFVFLAPQEKLMQYFRVS